MKAIVVPEFGDPEVMRYQEWPDPKPGVGEVLVRARGVGVNFADHLMRRGAYRGQEPPLVPGMEVAGEVVMVGPGVDQLELGQRVFGWTGQSYAELVAVPAAKLLPIPDRLSFEEAAAVPTVFGTAWMCLAVLAKVQPGERVLIHAAGSGVGSAAIQIAKALGAWVLATAGADWKLERARELGADATINYSAPDPSLRSGQAPSSSSGQAASAGSTNSAGGRAEAGQALAAAIERATGGRGVEVVLEGVGRATFAASVQALASLGRMVIYGSPSGARVELDTRQAIFKNLTIYGLAITGDLRTQMNVDEFRDGALPLFQQGRLKPVVHRVLPLSEAAEAHRIMMSRELFGKLVLVP